MYHLELRHFPHNMCRFNLEERQLRAIVEPWARGQVIELGEHRWNPQHASLTILEGPEIPIGQLTMGRGWSIAQRQGKDVTGQVIAAIRGATFAMGEGATALGAGAPPQGVPATPAGAGAAPLSDPFALGMQMAALLGPDAMRLLDAWRTVAASSPGLTPSEALAQAERALRSSRGAES